MSRNGAGTYSLYPGVNPVVSGTVISSTWANNTLSDIATAISASIAADGQTPITANLPMGSYRHTGVGNAAARTDYSSAGQIQDGSLIWCGTAGGTANALTLTATPVITAVTAGMSLAFKSGASPNSAATTVAIGGASSIAVQNNGAACVGGEIQANKWYRIMVDASLSSCQLMKFGPVLYPDIPAGQITCSGIENTGGEYVVSNTGGRYAANWSSSFSTAHKFQNYSAIASTILTVVPGSSGTGSGMDFYDTNVSANAQILRIILSGTTTRIQATKGASGTYQAMEFWTGGLQSVTIQTSGLLTAAFGVDVTDTTDASSSTTGSLKTAGGLGVAKKLYVGTTAVIGGLTDISGASAGQIKFPAAQNASADANTLDDYEEGTWTPSQGAGLTVVGAFSSSGKYTKIGRLVYIDGVISGATSVAAVAANVMTGNLPFTCSGVGVGTAVNAAPSASSALQVITTSLYPATSISATGSIYFSATYSV